MATMSSQEDIPVLDDLIEKGGEITMADLGLDDAPAVDPGEGDDIEIQFEDAGSVPADSMLDQDPSKEAVDPFAANPALEIAARRILEQHMERAWLEIRALIRNHLQDR